MARDKGFQPIPKEKEQERIFFNRLEARAGLRNEFSDGSAAELALTHRPHFLFDYGINGRSNFSTRWLVGPEIDLRLPLGTKFDLVLGASGGIGSVSDHKTEAYFPQRPVLLNGTIYSLTFPNVRYMYRPYQSLGFYLDLGFRTEFRGKTKATSLRPEDRGGSGGSNEDVAYGLSLCLGLLSGAFPKEAL